MKGTLNEKTVATGNAIKEATGLEIPVAYKTGRDLMTTLIVGKGTAATRCEVWVNPRGQVVVFTGTHSGVHDFNGDGANVAGDSKYNGTYIYTDDNGTHIHYPKCEMRRTYGDVKNFIRDYNAYVRRVQESAFYNGLIDEYIAFKAATKAATAATVAAV